MQEMASKGLYFSKFSWGACPRTLEVLAPSARVGQIRVRPPPPKFLSLYAYELRVKQSCEEEHVG